MEYTIAEVAQMLNLSKVATYKRINKMGEGLKPFTTKNKGITYISKDGLSKLKDAFNQDKVKTVKTVKSDRSALIEQYELRIKELTTTLERERADKDKFYNWYEDIKQQNQLLLESAAAKEQRKGILSKLAFWKKNNRHN